MDAFELLLRASDANLNLDGDLKDIKPKFHMKPSFDYREHMESTMLGKNCPNLFEPIFSSGLFLASSHIHSTAPQTKFNVYVLSRSYRFYHDACRPGCPEKPH